MQTCTIVKLFTLTNLIEQYPHKCSTPSLLLLIFVVMQFQQNLGINQKASKAKTKHLPSSPKMLPL